MAEKRNGLSLPTGILTPTTTPTRPEPEPEPEGQGGESDDAPRPRARKRRPAAAAEAAEAKGEKLYLSADVKFRLRMLAFKRGTTLSKVANEVLDKALPKWKLERAE
jgi:hypothetical protein